MPKTVENVSLIYRLVFVCDGCRPVCAVCGGVVSVLVV
jgi:hypothetical protein